MSEEEKVDVNAARKYMQEIAAPVVSKLVQELAISQPDNVLSFLEHFATREREHSLEKPKAPICCVSGTEAELKVKMPGSEIVEYFARDIFEALKRKNKLRGAVAVALEAEFPEIEPKSFELAPEEIERIADVKTTDEIDDRPVTPPRRGFEMTRPGENYHGGSAPRRSPINVGPVKFEARALGSENSEDPRDAALKAAAKRKDEQDKASNLTDEQRAVLKEKRKKDELIGNIRAHYALMGGVEPLGLAASSIEALERHLSQLKGQTKKRVEEEEEVSGNRSTESNYKESKIRQLMSGLTGNTRIEEQTLGAKPMNVCKFEPRALGTGEKKSVETSMPGNNNSASLSPNERRRIAAEAAASRLAAK